MKLYDTIKNMFTKKKENIVNEPVKRSKVQDPIRDLQKLNIPKFETIDIRSDPGFSDAYLRRADEHIRTLNRARMFRLQDERRRTKYTIPVGNLNKEQAEEQLKKLMTDYKKDIHWNDGIDYVLPDPWSPCSTRGQSAIITGKQIFSDIDPYGEENWEEDIEPTVPKRTPWNRGPHIF